jgi:hypothetical protein
MEAVLQHRGPVASHGRAARCPSAARGWPPVIACGATAQYFAWPSRRIAQVAGRFDEAYGHGAVSSICRNDDSYALRTRVNRIQTRSCDGSAVPAPGLADGLTRLVVCC